MTKEHSAPAFELVLKGQRASTVTLVQPDGGSQPLPYEDFRRVRYFPDIVELRFATVIVTLHGRNLLPVWRAIRSRRVRLLRVGRALAELERASDEPHIDRISIADRVVAR